MFYIFFILIICYFNLILSFRNFICLMFDEKYRFDLEKKGLLVIYIYIEERMEILC